MVDSQLYQREKVFSQLGNIQKQSSMCYCVECVGNRAQYSVSFTQDGRVTSECLDAVGLNPADAKLIVEFLYENAVTIQQWKDVILDIIARV